MRVSRPAILATLASSLTVFAAPTSYLGGNKVVQQAQIQTVLGQARTVTVTQPDQTVTATNDVTNVIRVTRIEEVTQPNPTSTQTVTVTAGTRTVYQKRGEAEPTANIEARAGIPPALASFAASRISSACSCIVVPKTSTITATRVQTVAGPQATQTQPARTVTYTVTRVVQVTSEEVITRTIGPTATVAQTVATTVTPILVKPKICNAKGLPGPNAFNYDANFNTNQADCIAGCKPDDKCLATGFYIVTDPTTGSSTGTCRKYDKPVTDSADLGFGYYNFNDRRVRLKLG
ncbi:Nn.00g021500.m01.CDS01 [Neocucurbitaria sp. VM-36]